MWQVSDDGERVRRCPSKPIPDIFTPEQRKEIRDKTVYAVSGNVDVVGGGGPCGEVGYVWKQACGLSRDVGRHGGRWTVWGGGGGWLYLEDRLWGGGLLYVGRQAVWGGGMGLYVEVAVQVGRCGV